ncbi:predicted protein [Arabidopsis lyrata subsp. lyrata]|uniref:Predicted protein n=1 Tax=Arabidopsis lyrata subsp. lyrata TaxID=81972 RepID=D7MQ08_ARALL|nr:putative pumilio homolog 13 [Arabidopsis lyrata subsp. lyrata]EFH41713.1 predicted protein [Arabidopsis lyrata subsp. lyrata]|eukprot:XP_002865454.1 putative pumilio homolog 13 [Arabidopsis lyrata subsp. lyrata]
MDNKFNGERNIWSTATAAEENLSTASSSSQSQPPRMQSLPFLPPENHIHRANGFSSHDSDLQTLESSFGGLSFADSSTVRQNGTRRRPRPRHFSGDGGGGGGSGVNGGGNLFPPSGNLYHHRELEEYFQRFNLNQQRLSYQNNCVNQSYGYDTLDNGFLNGVPYAPRNHVSDENPWGYINQDQMENRRGSLYAIAKDAVWSKKLLETIYQGTKETIDTIFDRIIVHICELMVDPYGKDVVMLLIGKCCSEQIIQIVDLVTQDMFQFVNICFDLRGTAAIQELLDSIHKRANDQIPRIMDLINSVGLQLAKSSNARFLILSCFRLFPLSHCRYLLEVVAQHCYEISIDQNGCCLYQQCLDKNRVPNPEIRQRLISEVISHALRLCLNCYGNYVVQYIVELNNQHVINALVRQLIGNYAHLARNKYGSHVVQKLLRLRGVDTRLIVVDLLSQIDTLLLDPFGNYVIQTAWFVSKDDVRHMLRYHIELNIRLMRCNKFGNKLLEKLSI